MLCITQQPVFVVKTHIGTSQVTQNHLQYMDCSH